MKDHEISLNGGAWTKVSSLTDREIRDALYGLGIGKSESVTGLGREDIMERLRIELVSRSLEP